ncbi:hypothetical protein TTHERM_00321659 (macronuclear) [Tetrahymena thermophila SB210]|uniref:Uncharacterized protein n=1 Tax=Tetrahymena thermophila (strain SB210) TaxID=312017 RepID=A4VE73_TETTS|nr:hypothetical protein TTHERM_00321659 [Tetrahymena thermophila SB210]EDK31827.1 hypothetical protein TTHERM_00321659 [Tetrahymena thermophila SB210]|eukprot:XP_001471284.1 hypothetical protein TTHERM_00321659 [Tetrahymena thermophila SB210]
MAFIKQFHALLFSQKQGILIYKFFNHYKQRKKYFNSNRQFLTIQLRILYLTILNQFNLISIMIDSCQSQLLFQVKYDVQNRKKAKQLKISKQVIKQDIKYKNLLLHNFIQQKTNNKNFISIVYSYLTNLMFSEQQINQLIIHLLLIIQQQLSFLIAF